jgi:hypothetical protein
LAKRVRAEGGTDPDGRVEYAFRLCTSRRPTPGERESIRRAYASSLQLMSADASSTAEICRKAAVEPADADFAAWFLVSQSLLNLDEVITKE